MTNDAVLYRALAGLVFSDMRENPASDKPWRIEMEDAIGRIQAMARDPNFAFSRPRQFHIPKDNGKYRTITVFSDPCERTLLALLNRYLTHVVDDALSPNVYAFRADKGKNRHTAIQALIAYNARHSENSLYVAECDIEDFYNHVSHAVARAALDKIDSRRQSAGAKPIDPHARRLTEAYLQASAAVLSPENTSSPHGLPQGGALSTLFANLVLTQADQAVEEPETDIPAFYARFCDDIIIAHPDRDVCQTALDRYRAVTHALSLPTHEPQDINTCNAAYYKVKSKNPFPWADPALYANAIPWVGFLGYQIRHDGICRVRNQSVRKQLDAQQDVIDELLKLLDRTPVRDLRKTPGKIVGNTIQRLIHMSVGSTVNRHNQTMQTGHCWVDAFSLLDDNAYTRSQCRALDQGREAQIRRLQHQFKKRHLLPDCLTQAELMDLMADLGMSGPEEAPAANKPAKPKATPFHYGAPYSYYAAIGRTAAPPPGNNTYNP